MNFIEQYYKEINKIEKNEPIGFYPFKTIPKSQKAKLKFAKVIKIEVKDAMPTFFSRLLNRSESDSTITKYLTKENLQKSRFYGKAEMIYSDSSLSEKEYIRSNIAKNLSNEFGLKYEIDFEVIIEDFVMYPEEKEFGFEDIVDLR